MKKEIISARERLKPYQWVHIEKIENKLKIKLWKEVEIYIKAIRKKIPYALIFAHGYNIDDKKEWKRLKKVFKTEKQE